MRPIVWKISLTESLILTLFYPSYLIYSILQLEQEESLSAKHTLPNLLSFIDLKKFIGEDEDLDGEEIGAKAKEPEAESGKVSLLLLPFEYLFRATIPKERRPELSFAISSFYCFLSVNTTMMVVDELVERFNVSPAFVGLTIASWGGNIAGKAEK